MWWNKKLHHVSNTCNKKWSQPIMWRNKKIASCDEKKNYIMFWIRNDRNKKLHAIISKTKKQWNKKLEQEKDNLEKTISEKHEENAFLKNLTEDFLRKS
jgi:hypothetical protein